MARSWRIEHFKALGCQCLANCTIHDVIPMITRKKLKRHLLFLLATGLLCFFASTIISLSVKNYYTPEKVTKRLNREIASAFTELNNEIQKVSAQDFQHIAGFHIFLDKTYRNVFTEKGIEILVYKGDSLKYWTDNVFAAPLSLSEIKSNTDIIVNGSGYYLVRMKQVRSYTIVALQIIKYNYKYSNEYLPAGFFRKFSVSDNAGIGFEPGKYSIFGPGNKFLFSLSYEQPLELALYLQYLIFALYLSSFLFLIAATFIIYMFLMREFGQKWLLFIVFVVDVIILRGIQFYFKFPHDLYDIQLFNPAFFASSEFLPSLGDFLINTILGVQLIFFAFNYFTSLPNHKILQRSLRIWITLLVLFIIAIMFYYMRVAISGLVLNSSISFRFENFLSLPYISHVGLFIIALLLFGFMLLFELLGRYIVSLANKTIVLAFLSLFVVLTYAFYAYFNSQFEIVSAFLLISMFAILVVWQRFSPYQNFKTSRVISTFIILAIVATQVINRSETLREQEKRVLLATHLADSRDNLAEYYFNEASKGMSQDTLLNRMIRDAHSDNSLSEISNYINSTYFSGYWNKYLIQVTVCQKDKKLSIKPGNIITGCEEYFDGKIEQYMRTVPVKGLYFLRQSVDAMYYLGKIKIALDGNSTQGECDIFVEISSNDIWKGLGYPELLIDSRNVNADNFFGYSYAFYNKGELVKNVGKYSFDTEDQNLIKQAIDQKLFVYNGYSHFIYKSDKDAMVVLSQEVPRFSDLISPFSYLFLILLILLVFINISKSQSKNFKIGIYTFRMRLQVIMISVIVISSIVLVTVSLLFINKLNNNKNNEILSEKLNSILVDLEQKYGIVTDFDAVSKDDLSELLLNLSNTYFTDVNLYNSKGFLLASSRDQIFREGMIAEQINPSGATKLISEKKSFFIQKESIGSYSFLSAYAPVRNIDNQLLGYLNLPYFAKQEEIRREISGLVSAFANIYIIMVVITVMLALLLSRYITKPLQHIGNQFSRIKIGDKNAKIEWNRKDEIGKLVDEYNRMIDEMEKSAELLARSERESAWRQMARQVAHEIKNPLTPIKLSMQLLMRAWNDKAPDWDVRLKRFSQTLIMQIDTLSSIATEFSDFAQMPEPQIQQFDVIPLVQQSAALFRDQSDCEISFETDLEECIILSDPNQILRVFNNLIKNALQAIPGDRQGEIRIKLTSDNQACEISFQDNGTGIPSDRQTRIFSPNFTTKTAGMGLGLAMVKNIIDNSSGRIWFETDPGEGTTFFVSLPVKG